MKNLKNYADRSAEVDISAKFLTSYSASFNNVLLFYSYPLDRQADRNNSFYYYYYYYYYYFILFYFILFFLFKTFITMITKNYLKRK